MGEWQPIASAPKGVPVLIYGRGMTGLPEIGVAWQEQFHWQTTPSWEPVGVSGYEWDFYIEPTHWQPLPPPPEQP